MALCHNGEKKIRKKIEKPPLRQQERLSQLPFPAASKDDIMTPLELESLL